MNLHNIKRGPSVHKVDTNSRTYYRAYRKKLYKIDKLSGGKTYGSYDLKEKEFNKITKDLNLSIQKAIIEGLEFKMPCRLGILKILKKKRKVYFKPDGTINEKYLLINYKATEDLWNKDQEAFKNRTFIYHLDEYTFKITWEKKTTIIPFAWFYMFKPCRQFKRNLAKEIKENPDINYFMYTSKK